MSKYKAALLGLGAMLALAGCDSAGYSHPIVVNHPTVVHTHCHTVTSYQRSWTGTRYVTRSYSHTVCS